MFENGFEVIADVRPFIKLFAYVPPSDSLKLTIERLQRDDPCWRKPRIRVMTSARKMKYSGISRWMDLPQMISERKTFA